MTRPPRDFLLKARIPHPFLGRFSGRRSFLEEVARTPLSLVAKPPPGPPMSTPVGAETRAERKMKGARSFHEGVARTPLSPVAKSPPGSPKPEPLPSVTVEAEPGRGKMT